MAWEDGLVDGEYGRVRQEGDRVEALWDFHGDQHAHIVTNDGLNADYVRDADGRVIVDIDRPGIYG